MVVIEHINLTSMSVNGPLVRDSDTHYVAICEHKVPHQEVHAEEQRCRDRGWAIAMGPSATGQKMATAGVALMARRTLAVMAMPLINKEAEKVKAQGGS